MSTTKVVATVRSTLARSAVFSSPKQQQHHATSPSGGGVLALQHHDTRPTTLAHPSRPTAVTLRQLPRLRALPPPGYRLAGPSDRYYWERGSPTDKPLGSGYTSTVYRGLDAVTGDAVAIKLVPKQKQRLLATTEYYRKLYQRLPLQSHASVLRLRDFIEDAQNFYIVSDLCAGPDLVDYVLEFTPRNIPLDSVRTITLQILLGIQHLHSRRLIHRDIKLDNILFADPHRRQITIVDFDMCLMADCPEPPRPPKTPEEVSVVGTKDYMAPEGYRGEYSEASDLWSIGVILYILLDGHFPYDLGDVSGGKEVREVLRRGITLAPEVRQRCPAAADFVGRLLEFDINKRITTTRAALTHPWFRAAHSTLPPPLLRTAQPCVPAPALSLSLSQKAHTFGRHQMDSSAGGGGLDGLSDGSTLASSCERGDLGGFSSLCDGSDDASPKSNTPINRLVPGFNSPAAPTETPPPLPPKGGATIGLSHLSKGGGGRLSFLRWPTTTTKPRGTMGSLPAVMRGITSPEKAARGSNGLATVGAAKGNSPPPASGGPTTARGVKVPASRGTPLRASAFWASLLSRQTLKDASHPRKVGGGKALYPLSRKQAPADTYKAGL